MKLSSITLYLSPFCAAAIGLGAQSAAPTPCVAPTAPAIAVPAFSQPTAISAPQAQTAKVIRVRCRTGDTPLTEIEVDGGSLLTRASGDYILAIDGENVALTTSQDGACELTAGEGTLTLTAPDGSGVSELHFGQLVLQSDGPPQATISATGAVTASETLTALDRLRLVNAPAAAQSTQKDDKIDSLEKRVRELESMLRKVLDKEQPDAPRAPHSVDRLPGKVHVISRHGLQLPGAVIAPDGSHVKRVKVKKTRVINGDGEEVEARVWVNGEEVEADSVPFLASIPTLGSLFTHSADGDAHSITIDEDCEVISAGNGFILKVGGATDEHGIFGVTFDGGDDFDIFKVDGESGFTLDIKPRIVKVDGSTTHVAIEGDSGLVWAAPEAVEGEGGIWVTEAPSESVHGVSEHGLFVVTQPTKVAGVARAPKAKRTRTTTTTREAKRLPGAWTSGSSTSEWNQIMREMRTEVRELRAAMKDLRTELRGLSRRNN